LSYVKYTVFIVIIIYQCVHPGMTEAPASDPAPLKVITLVKDTDEQLGFSIRGGSEYGLGIFISDVEEESAAGK